MISPEQLHQILGRIATANYTHADIEELAQELSVRDRNHLQLGKYNIDLTESQNIQIGDRVYQGIDADTIQDFIRKILSTIEERRPSGSEPPWSEVRKWYFERLEYHFRHWSEKYTDLRLTTDIRVATYKGQRLAGPSEKQKWWFGQALKRRDVDGNLIAKCIVVLGDPGGGKTTACQRYAWELAKSGSTSESTGDISRVPIYLEVSGYRTNTPVMSDLAPYERILALLAQEMQRLLAIHSVSLSLRNLESYLRASPFTFFFDGLNEVGMDQRESLIGDLLSFIDTFQGHDHQFVLTTRKFDYEYDLAPFLSGKRFEILEILEFDGSAVNQFVMRDLGALGEVNSILDRLPRELKMKGLEILDRLIRGDFEIEDGEELVLQIKKLFRNVPGLQKDKLDEMAASLQSAQHLISILRQPDYRRVLWLAQNPSTLKDIVDVYRAKRSIPHNRTLLFANAIDARLNAQLAKRGHQRSRFSRELKFAVLQKIAVQMIDPKHGLRLEQNECLGIAEEVLEKLQPTTSPHDLLHECVFHESLLVEKAFGTYSFEKQPYQEYFVARELCDQWRSCLKAGKSPLKDKYLGPVLKDRYYFQVVSSMAGLLAPGEVQGLLKGLRKTKKTQRLAALCGRNAEELPAETVKEFIDWTRVRILRFSVLPEGIINAVAILSVLASLALFLDLDRSGLSGRISFGVSTLIARVPFPGLRFAFFNLLLSGTGIAALLISRRLVPSSKGNDADRLNIYLAISITISTLITMAVSPIGNWAATLATLSGCLWIVLLMRVSIVVFSPGLNWMSARLEENVVNHHLIHYLEVMRDIGPDASSTINEIQYLVARDRFMSDRIKDAIQRTWAVSPRTVLQVINEINVPSRQAEAIKVLETAVLRTSASEGLREKAVAALLHIANTPSNTGVMLGVVDVLGNIALEQHDYKERVISFLKQVLMNSDQDLRVRRRVWRCLYDAGVRDFRWPRRTFYEIGLTRWVIVAVALAAVCALIVIFLIR